MRFPLTAALLLLPSLLWADDYLVVAGSPELEAAVEPLLAHRRAEGLNVTVVSADGGREAIRAKVGEAAPDYLLLVGDVDTIPTWIERAAATDRPYADGDGDGWPEAAVGRIPSSDPAVAGRIAARTVLYERGRDVGPWRKQLALVAGEARFSPQLDAVIEALFTRVVRDAVDPAYDVDLTYANPRSAYCYPAEGFRDRVLERLNEGALVYAYVGHGQVTSVDDLTVRDVRGRKRRYPILEASSADRLKSGLKAPVFVAIACWTGKFEGDEPCIGEALLAAGEGPVAFFGASRVSQPVQNALLARELVAELCSGVGEVRLGPALDRARKAMVQGRGQADPVRLQVLGLAHTVLGGAAIEAEMPRHVDMYNLLGDPALRLARAAAAVELSAPVGPHIAGAELVVTGQVPFAGALRLTLETARDRCARPDPAEDETEVERYRRVNDKVVLDLTPGLAEDGSFSAPVTLPRHLLSGSYRLKAFLAGAEGQVAVGAATLQVAADPSFDPWEDEEN